MKLIWLVIFFYWTILSLSGQTLIASLSKEERKQFNKITHHAKRVPGHLTLDPQQLSEYLIQPAQSELEKARSIFVWIAYNITYDMKAVQEGVITNPSADYALRNRVAVCQGYSNLFNALCEKAGLDSKTINGYSKGLGYQKGEKFYQSDHSWNAVKINNGWYLVDVTWAATQTNDPKTPPPSVFQDQYFLMNPTEFLIKHLPEDPIWQLVNNPISLTIFEQGSEEIKMALNTVSSNMNYRDSLEALEIFDRGYQEIYYYQRVLDFNPRNRSALYWLGSAYLMKGLDTMETLYDLGHPEILTAIPTLKQDMFNWLAKADHQFSLLQPLETNYKDALQMRQEVIYQKGIFNYEVGMRMMNILSEVNRSTFYQIKDGYRELINSYFDEAITYFEKIKEFSFYYHEAQEYIHDYIEKYRPR